MKNKRFLIGNIIVLAACLAFNFLFWAFGETIVTKDAPSYINMVLSREPFYPSFLALFRTIFGASTDTWLIAVTFAQSMLQAVCTYFFIRFFCFKIINSLLYSIGFKFSIIKRITLFHKI